MFLKKVIFTVIFTFAVVSVFSGFVLPAKAQGISGDISKQLGAAAGSSGAGFAAPQDPRTIVMQIIRVILGLIGTVFFALTIYAGYLWMTAAGNEEQVTKAKTLLFQTVIGLAIILAANSIVSFGVKLAMGQSSNFDNGVGILPAVPNVNYAPY